MHKAKKPTMPDTEFISHCLLNSQQEQTAECRYHAVQFKLVLEKAEEPKTKLPTSAGSWKKQESSRKESTSASLIILKPLTAWITTNWKILKDMGIPEHLTCFMRNLFAVKKQQL